METKTIRSSENVIATASPLSACDEKYDLTKAMTAKVDDNSIAAANSLQMKSIDADVSFGERLPHAMPRIARTDA